MLIIYRCLINILFPLIIIVIFLRVLFNKEDRSRFKEKLFFSSLDIYRNSNRKLIWFHAASIGELKSIVPLIKKLKEDDNFEFLITTVTISSAQLFDKEFLYQKNISHRFFPIDKPSLIKKFLLGWKPDLAIFVDSEIWPNFLFEIKKIKIPLILLNARITKKTFQRWNLFPKLAEKIFSNFDLCLASSSESIKYLKKMNVRKIYYFGNLKLTTESKVNDLNPLIEKLLLKRKFWCAISTHQGEDIFCLKTHLEIKKNIKNIITIIIPRHVEKATEIEAECKKLGLKSQILSHKEIIEEEKEIIIINSYGVMSNYLRLCKSVFIGKSMLKKLKPVGGQNPIEAAKLGCKIYHGPYVYNFQEIYELFNQYQISERVEKVSELSQRVIHDLMNSKKINDEKITVINNLGKKILNDTYEELIKIYSK